MLKVIYLFLHKHPIGGRITVIQTSMPNIGPGVIKMREQTSATKMVLANRGVLYNALSFSLQDQLNMSAGSDFYKKLALECSAQQIAVDLFVFSNTSQFLDLPTICKLLFILSINLLSIYIQ